MSDLAIRKHANGYAIVIAKDTVLERVVARSVPNEFIAKAFACIPELVDAAIFAASVIKTQGMFDLSEKLAYEKLEAALAIAGVGIDTAATQMFDVEKTGGVR